MNTDVFAFLLYFCLIGYLKPLYNSLILSFGFLILFHWYSNCLKKKALEAFGDIETGQIIRAGKFADDFVLGVGEETVLQGMMCRLMESGKCSGVEMNVVKTKVMRLSKKPSAG